MPVSNIPKGAPNCEKLKLNIIRHGVAYSINVLTDAKVENVISLALDCILNDINSKESVDNSDAKHFKLISVSSRRVLRNDNLINHENVKNNEELLLVQRRLKLTADIVVEDSMKGPTKEEIIEATKSIEAKKYNRPQVADCSADFHGEIRKIFITLAQASSVVLTASSQADEVVAMLKERLSGDPDPKLVAQIVKLGYSQSDATEALKKNQMCKMAALSWLEKENSGSVEKQVATTSRVSDQTISEYVNSLLTNFRAKKRRDFQPNVRAMSILRAMGFEDETLIEEALLISGNNPSAACEWILNEQHTSLVELDEGLNQAGAVYEGIMSNPEIRLSIHKPRMLLAFLSMIEDPGSIGKWLNDVDAAPVLTQIFKTYHREKNAVS